MNLYTFPTELVEMVLVTVGHNHHYVLGLVCRQWHGIIHNYRQRQRLPSIIQTPYGVAGVSIEMLKWSITRGLCPSNVCEAAVHASNIKVLEWAADNDYDTHDIAAIAALTNQLSIMEWGYENHYNFDEGVEYFTTQRGDLPMIQWLHVRGLLYANGRTAATYGHVHILEYLFKYDLIDDIDDTGDTFYGAIENGHCNVVQWCLDKGYIFDNESLDYAVACGQKHIVELIHTAGIRSFNICETAAINNHLEVLKWARANNYPWDERTCSGAAENGHLQLLQWARTNGCPWDVWTCHSAAVEGHLEVLQWAHVNGCPWNEDTCKYAAEHGNLKVLQWAHVNGCPWDESTCRAAAANDHIALLLWAHANDCPE